MTYLVMSHSECVGAGEIHNDNERMRVSSSEEKARQWFSKRLKRINAAVVDEIDVIENNEHLTFDSPYIVWIAILCLPFVAASTDEAIKCLLSVIRDSDEPCGEVKKLVIQFQGSMWAPKGQEDYSLDRAIEGLVAWLG